MNEISYIIGISFFLGEILVGEATNQMVSDGYKNPLGGGKVESTID